MSVDLPTAADARARLNSIHGLAERTQIMQVSNSINTALENGRDSINTGTLRPSVCAHLKNMGYKVEHHAALDQRDEAYYTVSW